jgi:hypothetical protein
MGNCLVASSQDALFFNEAMKSIATQLTQQLNSRGIKQAGVADFTYQGRANTRIGKQMADDLSVRLTMSGARFVMTNRDVVRKALAIKPQKQTVSIPPSTTEKVQEAINNEGKTEEQKQQDQIGAGIEVVSLIPSLLKSEKVLKGTDAVIFGKIEDRGDYFNIIIEVTENSKRAANIGGAIVNIIKTEDLKELTVGEVQPVAATPVGGGGVTDPAIDPISGDTPKFKHQTIQFEITGCTQSGRDVECKLNIFSEVDLDYYAYFDKTRFINAVGGKEYVPSEIRLSDASNTQRYVVKSLVQNIPIPAVIRFSNVNEKVSNMAKLEVHSSSNNSFTAVFYNVAVQ